MEIFAVCFKAGTTLKKILFNNVFSFPNDKIIKKIGE